MRCLFVFYYNTSSGRTGLAASVQHLGNRRPHETGDRSRCGLANKPSEVAVDPYSARITCTLFFCKAVTTRCGEIVISAMLPGVSVRTSENGYKYLFFMEPCFSKVLEVGSRWFLNYDYDLNNRNTLLHPRRCRLFQRRTELWASFQRLSPDASPLRPWASVPALASLAGPGALRSAVRRFFFGASGSDCSPLWDPSVFVPGASGLVRLGPGVAGHWIPRAVGLLRLDDAKTPKQDARFDMRYGDVIDPVMGRVVYGGLDEVQS